MWHERKTNHTKWVLLRIRGPHEDTPGLFRGENDWGGKVSFYGEFTDDQHFVVGRGSEPATIWALEDFTD